MSVSATRLVLTMKKVTGSIWLLDGLGPAASAHSP
jgi:hypothetical protein